MGYPEPIPVLRGRAAKDFLQRWKDFALTPEQRAFYRGAKEEYLAWLEKERKEGRI